jgi:hypothetical protein
MAHHGILDGQPTHPKRHERWFGRAAGQSSDGVRTTGGTHGMEPVRPPTPPRCSTSCKVTGFPGSTEWLTQTLRPSPPLLPIERPLWTLQHVAALLVERPGDQRREAALNALNAWALPLDSTERGLVEWLVDQLSEVRPTDGPSVPLPDAT